MADKFAEENFILFAISDLTDQGTYWTINISAEASSATSPFSGGEALVVSFVVTGDKGDDGTSGSSGSSGYIRFIWFFRIKYLLVQVVLQVQVVLLEVQEIVVQVVLLLDQVVIKWFFWF